MFEELGSVLRYIPQQIDKLELVQLHSQLAESYRQALSNPSEEVTRNITDITQKIDAAQSAIDPKSWDQVKLRIFEKLGARKVMGEAGYKNLVSRINQHLNDPMGASQVVDNFVSEMTNLKARCEQSVNNLESLLLDDQELPEGAKKLQIVFDGLVSIEKFSDLIEQADDWQVILDTFKQVVPQPQEDARLLKIYKSSPTVIVIVAQPDFINLIAETVKLAVDIAQLLLTIRLIQLEVKKVGLESKNLATALEAIKSDEQEKLKKHIDEKTKTLLEVYGIKAKTAEAPIRINIKKIYNFTVSGGTVNLVDGKLESGKIDVEQSQLSSTYEKLKKLNSEKDQLLLAEITQEEKRLLENAGKSADSEDTNSGTVVDKTINKRGRPKKLS